MIKKALIIVPHQDDEINIAHGLFENLKKNDVETTVVFCTNGDYFGNLSKDRRKEAEKVKLIFGYNRLIYLGYGDGWENGHIYHSNSLVRSHSGMSETYSPTDDPEYCYQKRGRHNLYCKNNFKSDLKEVILDIRADLIVCNDIDFHPDHKCVSLLFDEVVREIIDEYRIYKPYILKAFAYEGAWYGPRDYFYPHLNNTYIDYMSQATFPYEWKDRICFIVPRQNNSLQFWKSKVFKALCTYKTQNADSYSFNRPVYCFSGISNADCVYWYRSINSLSYHAKVEVSSGNKKYLNDFKLFDTIDILNKEKWIGAQFWTPDFDDSTPYVIYRFQTLTLLQNIVIYQNKIRGIKKLELSFSNGYSQIYNCQSTNRINIILEKPIESMFIKISIIEKVSDIIQVGEIEIYKELDNINITELPFDLSISSNRDKARSFIVRHIYQLVYDCCEKYIHYSSKIKYKKHLI